MANLLANRLSVQLSDNDLLVVDQSLKSIHEVMPFLIGLTPREREALPKIDVSNKAFVEDAVNVLKTESLQMPEGVNAVEMQKDLNLYMQLDRFELQLLDMLTKVRHTKMLAGSEAYTAALFVYRLVETYHLAGIPGYAALYNQLRKRFIKQGGSKTNDEDNNATDEQTTPETNTPQ